MSVCTSVKKHLNKTSGGKIFEKNLLDVFGMMIISLDLKPERKPKPRYAVFAKNHPFSFDVQDAIATMALLKLNIELKTATTTISYAIQPELAFALLKRFFEGKLLHCPASRTDSVLTLNMQVQVTPKGTAMVFNFCNSIGMSRENMPAIVKSSFNTMALFLFDRSSTTDKILYSEYLIHVLFVRLMGPSPNIWSPYRKPEPVSNLFDVQIMQPDFGFAMPEPYTQPWPAWESPCLSEVRKFYVSPFHHKYFTNPESDSHVQFYYSNEGMRVFHDRVYHGQSEEVKVDYSFSGKAMVQWLCDCTGLLSVSEAVEIGNLFSKSALIVPITVTSKRFKNDRDVFYTLTEFGRRVCQWDSKKKLFHFSLESSNNSLRESITGTGGCTEEMSGDLQSLSLRDIVLDPGIRFLFKMHMQKERCSENIDAYVLLLDFGKLKEKLARLLRHHKNLEEGERKAAFSQAIENQANTCYSAAFHLYSTYISLESQYDLNIDFALRQEVYEVMSNVSTQPKTDYLKTPICPKLFQDEQAIETPTIRIVDEHQVNFNEVSDESQNRDDPTPAPREIVDTIAALNKIHVVFGKIASSIYRLMELDSYPKFVTSDDYLSAVGLRAPHTHS